MREFLSIAIMPLPIFFLLILVGLYYLIIKRFRPARIIFFIVGCWVLIISTKLVPSLLVKSLEKQFPQLSDAAILSLPDTLNIIVLGGGHSDDPMLSPNNQLSLRALGRLVEGVRIYKAVTESRRLRVRVKLVVSGFPGRLKVSQAEVLYKTALILDVDSADLIVSNKPGNTIGEAEEYKRIYGTKTPLIVVTDAVHMPRAMTAFKKIGLHPVPAPTNHFLKHSTVKNPWQWVPSTGNIIMLETAFHEYMGLLWLKLGGH